MCSQFVMATTNDEVNVTTSTQSIDETTQVTTEEPDGQTYTIKYDKQGYTGSTIKDSQVQSGEEVEVSIYRLIREGYAQYGWSDGVTEYAFGDTFIMPNHDVTFTPVWRQIFSINYDLSEYPEECEDIVINQPNTCEGETITLSRVMIQVDGVYHYGWNDGTNTYARGDEYVVPSSNVVFTPVFYNYYTITYSAGDVEGIVGNSQVSFERYQNAVFDLADSTRLSRTGYTLSGWHCVEEDKDYQTVSQYTMPSYNTVMEAIWTPKNITLAYSSDGETVTEKVLYDSEFTFPECSFIKDGYTFKGWSVGTEVYQPGDTIIMNLSANRVSIKALWEEGSTDTTTSEVTTVTEPIQTTTSEVTTVTEPIETTTSEVTSNTEPTETTSSGDIQNVIGDLNGDGSVKTNDLLILKKHLLGIELLEDGSQSLVNADINSDGNVKSNDLLMLKKILLGI